MTYLLRYDDQKTRTKWRARVDAVKIYPQARDESNNGPSWAQPNALIDQDFIQGIRTKGARAPYVDEVMMFQQ